MSQVAFYDRLVMSQNYDKSNLKLDFENRPSGSSRKRRFLGVSSPALLQSPDLKLLKLGSPELEKLIIQHNGFIPTPTPGGGSSLTQSGENSADDKESFARGFIEALQKLQEQDVPQSKNWDIPTIIGAVNENSTSETVSSSKSTTSMSSTKWEIDHNRNSVPVITNRYDSRTPPLTRQPTATPVLINFPTVSSGGVSTMGMTSVPIASSLYTSRPQASLPDQNRLSHQVSSHSMTTSGMTLPTPVGVASTSAMLEPIQIKSEDDAIVPSLNASSPDLTLDMNPIDLDAQEHIKHQRKKLRNRLAAQRCRKRKIEREDTLKIKVKELKSKNSELSTLASTLRMQVCDLKEQVMRHVHEGCQVFLKDNEDDKSLLSKNTL